MRYFNNRFTLLITAFTVLLVGLYACDKPPFGEGEPPNPNELPTAELTNVPVEGDTLFANVTLHWDGGDNDGFVDNYVWQYETINPETGETMSTTPQNGWNETGSTSLTITFNSPQPLNRQIFRVRAIDNKEDSSLVDSASTKTFYTEQTVPPTINIAQPENGAEKFFRNEATDWFPGILLTYEGEDEDGEIIEYGWKVGTDDEDYHWTSDTSVTIPPEEFGSQSEAQIIVKAKDDTNLDSEDPDTVTISLVRPTFDKKVLIIDETNEQDFQRSGGQVSNYDDEDVDSLYRAWVDLPSSEYDEWDYVDEQDIPSLEVLGQYQMIFWHGDNWYGSSNDAHSIGNHRETLSEYMSVGGDFIMSGWKMLKSLRPGASYSTPGSDDYPYTYAEEDFEREYLHIQSAGGSGSGPPGEMVGANGIGEYPDITIDSSKVDGYPVTFYDNIIDVNIIEDAAGFTSPIFTFECRAECGTPQLRGKYIAVRYFGTSFDAVVFGFPIFFMQEEDAEQIVDQILTNMGYRDQEKKTMR